MMSATRRIRAIAWSLITLCAFQALPSHSANQPYIETGPGAERSFDGLYRVEHTRFDAVWIREDFDLSGYTRILVRGEGIAYRPTTGTGRSDLRGGSEFSITERNRQRLSEALREEIMEELGKGKQYQLADEPGDDVLLLRVGMIDVVSFVPPERPGRVHTYLHTVGEATLVLELRDSMTGTILARAADRRAAGTHYMQPVNSVTVRGEVATLADSWGRLLRQRLDQLFSLSEEVAVVKP